MTTVLHVIDTTGPGGAETVFLELADRLRSTGYRSLVLLRGKGWVFDEAKRRGLEPILLDAKGSFNWRYLLALCRLIRREKVDIVQSHLLGSNVYCAAAGWLTRTPVVATFHGAVDVGENERFRWLKFRLMQLGVSRYVAVSNSLAREIAEQRLLDPKRSIVIHNGIDVAQFQLPRNRLLHSELDLPDDAIIIGSLGNVRPAKGYDVLIEAAGRLCKSEPQVCFVVAGDIKQSVMRPLAARIDELALQDHVRFLGFRENVPEFLAGLDLFVLPSTSEGFSIATIQALAAGLPVIATRSGGPEEILEGGAGGKLVPPGDPETLAEAIRDCLREGGVGIGMNERGQSVAAERFSIDSMMGVYESLYRENCGA